nr:group II intron reverse transcriptase/maturase [Vibrio cholerae]
KKLNTLQHRPKPAKRIYIVKKNGKLRPLGIPTIKDRVYQNIVRNALEPQWEARFEAISYGFRPKRNTHDAIRSIFNRINGGTKKKWIFE